MPSIEIVFEAQMLNAATTAPHKLQGLYPDFDMPFDIVKEQRPVLVANLMRVGHSTAPPPLLTGEERDRLEVVL
jgi:hypothetical protein